MPPAIALAVEGGIDFLHLRAPQRGARETFEFGAALLPILRDRTHLVVNDRIDVAVALGARFVQIPNHSLPVAVARRSFPNMGIGASVHSVEESVAAERDGADWLMLGTIFSTSSHPGRMGAGPQLIEQVRAVCQIPIVAIGGINLEGVEVVRVAGASGIAVISAVLSADDPRSAARSLRDAILDKVATR